MVKYLFLLIFMVSCSGNPLGDERSNRDRNPPVGATISGWVWSLSSPDNGSLSNDNTPIVDLSGAGEEEGAKVRLYNNSTCTNQIGSTRTIRNGITNHSNISFDSTGADDGLIEIFATVEDTSLNLSDCTNTQLSYTLAAGVPLVGINSPVRISQSNQALYELSGQCSEAGLNVIVQIAGLAPMNALCSVSNTWLLTGLDMSSLPQGSINILADHTDMDMVAAVQVSAVALKDTISPSLTEVQAFTWSLSSPASATISNDTTPVLSLTNAVSEEAGSVSVFSDNACSVVIGANSVISSGALSFNNINLQSDGTDDGGRGFFVVVADSFGNPSVCVDILQSYTLDTIAPNVAVLSAVQVTTSNQNSYGLSGTCSEPGQQVNINIAGISPATQPTCSGANNWNVVGLNLSTAPEGNLSLIVSHQDQAGNTSTHNLIINKDTTAPSSSEINAFTWGLSSPSNGSISNDTSPVVRLSAASSEEGASVQVFDNASCSSSKGVSRIITSGITEHTDITYLSDNSDDGVISFFVVITDTAGNISNCENVSLSYTLDTAAPTVTLSAPSNITSANASSYSLNGTCSEPGSTLNVSVGAVSANPQPVCSASNTWSIVSMDASGAAEGAINVIARLSDPAGNNAVDASASITKDAIAPTQTEIQNLNWTLSSPVASSNSNDATPILDMSGASAFNGGSVRVFSDSVCSNLISSSASINLGATNHSDITFASDGSQDGLKNFFVIVSDAGANNSSCTDTLVSYTLDTSPASFTVNTPGNISSLNQASYSLSGTCSEVGQVVNISIGSLNAAPQPSCIAGNVWSLTGFDASSLSEGNVTIILNHSDSAANAAPTQNIIVIKDTTAPSVAAIQALSWSLSSPGSGVISSDTTPEISVSGAGAEDGALVQVHINSLCSTPQGNSQTITSGQTNHTDIALASDGSQDGAIGFFATLTDSFGNTSGCADISLGYTLDTQPPSVAITSALNISSSNQSSYSVSGTCSDIGQGVVILVGGIAPGANPICSAGNIWNLTSLDVSSLPEGSVSIIVNHQDTGGNSAPTASLSVNKDVTAPTVSEIQALSWSLSSPGNNSTSSDNTPVVNLVAATSEEGGLVQLFGNSSCTITRGASQTINSGVTSHSDIILATDGSDDGIIRFYARVSDAVGNISNCADISLNYTFDTTVPIVGLNAAANISVLNQASYSLSGSCSEVGENINILIGTLSPSTPPQCSASNTWVLNSIDVSSLSDGSVLINVNHSDTAGNSALQQSQTVNKDTMGPSSTTINSWSWSLSSPSANSTSMDTTPQVSLSGAGAEEGGSVQVYIDSVCSSSLGASQNISSGSSTHSDITFASDGSADGLKQFFVIVADSLGNPSVCTNISREYTLDTTAPTTPEVLAFTWQLSSPSNGSNSQDTTPVITLSGASSENGASVQIFDNVTCTLSRGSAQTISGGSTLHNDISYLNDGSNDGLISFYARVTDSANNISNCIDVSLGYTLDTSLPMVAITAPVDITPSNQSSYSLNGTCTEEMQAITLSVGGISPAIAPLCGSGVWALSGLDVSGLSDGNIVITANHSDGVGNNALEDTQNVTKDTTAPSSADILNWTWMQSSPGASSVSSDGTPIVNMSGATSENGTIVQLYLDPVCFETAGSAQTISAEATSHGDITFPVDGSADGAINYYTQVTDSSGNVSSCVNINLGYTLDSTAPTTTEVQALTWTLVSPSSGSTSNETSPIITLSNASSLNGGGVQLFSDTVCTSTLGASQTISSGSTSHNDFSFASNGSEDGIKRFYTRITDTANNTSGCIDISLNYTLDTIAPTLAITVANDITNGTQGNYSVSGTCNSIGSQVVVSVGGISPATNPICNFNAWSISGLDVSALAEGNVIINANMSDSAGNPAPTATVTVNKDTSGPSNPSNLILTQWADPQKSETLTWTASTDDMMIARYEVRLETSPGGTVVDWTDIGNTTTYTFVNGVDMASFTLSPGTNYFMLVRAFDNDGNVSANIRSAAIRFFRPTIPVGLNLWFDMSDMSTLFQDAACTIPVVNTGDPIACIQSLVGVNRSMTTTNASDNATFDASINSLEFNGASHGNYVMNQTTTNNSVAVLARLDSGYATNAGLFNQGANISSRNMQIDQTTGCFRANNDHNEDSSDFTFGLTTSLRLNALREECVTEGNSFLMVANSDTSDTYLFQIGQQNAARFWKGGVQEVIVYNNTTSDSTAIDIEGYLACKWNLRDKLPTGHLYYNADPLNNDNCP